jgi:anti-sigma-K factor RskA
MRHPNQATLALHAGGDLGTFARWRTERHLSRCEECREEIAAYRRMRSILPDLAETPEIQWNRLAAEMKANIRLGLAAGECVRDSAIANRRPPVTGWRAAVAFGSIAALVAAGITLERPAPVPHDPPGIVAEATPDNGGIQMREGRQALLLLHPDADARHVTYTAGAQGSMEARYVDRDTGYVTVNRIDVD